MPSCQTPLDYLLHGSLHGRGGENMESIGLADIPGYTVKVHRVKILGCHVMRLNVLTVLCATLEIDPLTALQCPALGQQIMVSRKRDTAST